MNQHIPIGTFAATTKKLGFPWDITQHEQLCKVGKLWSLPIHSDESNIVIEIIGNQMLYVLWAVRAGELADTLPPNEALR
jgi:hypothetical protein